jgi:Ketosteroid isomerase-related protein
MSDHPNAEALRKGYEAFAAGDMETVKGLFVDGITWHQSGDDPTSGDFVGKDAILGNFARLFQPRPFRGRAVHVWHMTDGIATEAWLTGEDQAAADVALTP